MNLESQLYNHVFSQDTLSAGRKEEEKEKIYTIVVVGLQTKTGL